MDHPTKKLEARINAFLGKADGPVIILYGTGIDDGGFVVRMFSNLNDKRNITDMLEGAAQAAKDGLL